MFLKKKNTGSKWKNKIAHSELRLKQAQAIAHFGSWELDFVTGIADWSEEFCKIYGLPSGDNIQSYQSWISFVHPEDMEYTKKMTNEARRGLTSFAFHHRIIRKDGSVKHIYAQAEFEFDKDGKPAFLHGVAHDITEMKEAEAERTKIVADIVQRNSDLEQFSYIVSHNLRAPVANILGIVDVMQTIGLDKEEVTTVMGYLQSAAKSLDGVIIDLNYILELKNNFGGRREYILFDDLLKEVKLSIDNRNIEELVNVSGNFSEARGITTVKSYLYSIFFNLISNSIKYRQQGIHITIEISSHKINNKIQLLFRDNGLGINIEKSGKEVFGLYKRFHRHIEGKGMGLFIVKNQVELLGGKITIVSEVDKGTEFCIEFDGNSRDMRETA